MAEHTVTVLVAKELLAELAELGDWSPPVQVKIIATPGVGTGYEMIARTVPRLIEELRAERDREYGQGRDDEAANLPLRERAS